MGNLKRAIAIYGGFFGGGGGILLLAVLEMTGMKNVHTMNALKSWLATCLNAAALIHFIAAGIVVWVPAILMAMGALLGGYASAYFARQIHPSWGTRFYHLCWVCNDKLLFATPARLVKEEGDRAK